MVKETVTGAVRDAANVKAEQEDVIINPLQRLSQQFRVFNQERKKLVQSGYAKDLDKMGEVFDRATQKSLELFGTLTEGENALAAFREGTQSFVFMSKAFQNSLIDMTVTMQGLGVEATTLASVVDSSVYAFGSSKEEIENVMTDLVNLSDALSVPADQLAKDFKKAQEGFAYQAGEFKKNFEGLQLLARQTGISFDSLTSTFGSSFDSFSGAAQKAGQLNQILGESAFNSIDLLNKTEEERASTIRNVFLQRGRDASEMGKFELMAIKDTIGLGSIEETRKFLRGGSLKDLKGSKLDKLQTGGKDELSKRMDAGAKNMSEALKDIGQEITKYQTPVRRALISLGNTLQAEAKKIGEKALIKAIEAKLGDVSLSAQAVANIKSLGSSQKALLAQYAAILKSGELKQLIDTVETSGDAGIEGYRRSKVSAKPAALTGLEGSIKNIDSVKELVVAVAAISAATKTAQIAHNWIGLEKQVGTLVVLNELGKKLQKLKGTDQKNIDALTKWTKDQASNTKKLADSAKSASEEADKTSTQLRKLKTGLQKINTVLEGLTKP